jgi:hypothetical protein
MHVIRPDLADDRMLAELEEAHGSIMPIIARTSRDGGLGGPMLASDTLITRNNLFTDRPAVADGG